MKTLILSLLFAQLSLAQTPPLEIKKMAGCYQVTYDFTEVVIDPNYPVTSPHYTEGGTEWVEIDRDSEGRIDLQHILQTVIGPIKHWRHEWTKAPTYIWNYKGRSNFVDPKASLVWEKQTTNGDAEAWGQRVVQVDDSPRYDCAARWENVGSQMQWQCEAAGPLPRREFSIRDDYDIVLRTNRHYNNLLGWKHEQDNKKVQSQDGRTIAYELGNNTYIKVPDENCKENRDWWNQNKNVWHFIQGEWEKLLSKKSILKIKTEVNDEPIWRTLSLWAQTHKDVQLTAKHSDEVQKLINSFLEK